ncbi:hypothetical protein H206_03203 [Candidatus Electrothrix aarhusensis]|uniref:Uncharacterized protein n=1 Tax=Candidatus Electrothrix aarhusensis TaxID=1859131 RepID=A0A444IRZ2_9BACT|nr:hypothetical protein H206_03203 [Candidatus Electrothrix aarhusensis]
MMRVKNIKSDTIVGQLLINLIDKIIIGGIVGLVALYATNKLQEQQKLKELTFSVSGIKTSILKKQRDNLIDKTTDYIRFVKSSKIEMYGKIFSDDGREKILELENDIEAIVFNIKIISEDYDEINKGNKGNVSKKGDSFVDAINSFSAKLINEESSAEEIDEKVFEISKRYKDIVIAINEVILQVLKKEFEDSRHL